MLEHSIKSNAEIMACARKTLRDRWKVPVLVSLVYLVLYFGIDFLLNRNGKWLSHIFNFAIAGPVALAFASFYVSAVRNDRFDTNQLARDGKQYWGAFITGMVMTVMIFLWALLLVVPGIMAAFSYAMAYFVRNDQPELSAWESIQRSKKLMYGHRIQYFGLSCRFIGWALLACLTLGIGLLWLIPYFQTTVAHFYVELLRAEQSQIEMSSS